MKDLLFLVADGNMSEAVAGMLGRSSVHLAIGCGAFDFDGRRDVKVAKGQNDPGLLKRADELLRPYSGEYQHAVVVVDEEWGGSPGADAIRQQLDGHLERAGWPIPDGLSLVVRPEADVWLWSDSPHTPTALGWASWTDLRPALEREGWMAEGDVKPPRPKEAAEWALQSGPKRLPRSSALYRQVASKVSVNRCQDDAYLDLLDALRVWFPIQEAIA
jgi:hypothetical protein